MEIMHANLFLVPETILHESGDGYYETVAETCDDTAACCQVSLSENSLLN